MKADVRKRSNNLRNKLENQLKENNFCLGLFFDSSVFSVCFLFIFVFYLRDRNRKSGTLQRAKEHFKTLEKNWFRGSEYMNTLP